MLSAISLTETALSSAPLFDGLVSTTARITLLRSGFAVSVPSDEADIAEYIGHFSGLWQRVGDGSTPNPHEVRRQMDCQEAMLYELWNLALLQDFPKATRPDVVQAAVTKSASPLILSRQRQNSPLIIMATGLWTMVLGCVLGLLNWAEYTGHRETMGKRIFQASVTAWVENDPSLGPVGGAIADAATIDLDITHFAVGLANAAFTWAFLHEMGHFYLNHLPAGRTVNYMAAGGVQAETRHYSHLAELEADRFGFGRFLALLPHTQSIREKMPFGPQIDHAPILLLEIIDLAYTITDKPAWRASPTHPPPLVRATALREDNAQALSEPGRDFYAYFHERLLAINTEF
ncbi:hypothetical protein [Methylovulum psychrotolerans]|uniref:Uncharacterized protein n=1 Tax=Methylovulum psychrotolerans TaxID=1704499 RepID=A0A2S5CIH2_9GAMM|nr:hypothetical protein [Methylovulum psychrotolerans]POZ50601.1 hypothetical protein AADEFJLK_03494 [Methylovulum psychrotolerans]